MYEEIIKLFEIPECAAPYVTLFLTDEEIKACLAMGKTVCTEERLTKLLSGIVEDPKALIRSAYSRSVLSKVMGEGAVSYFVTNFYKRLAPFAQYEPDKWNSIPEVARKAMDAWCLGIYADGARPRLAEALKDSGKFIENAHFYSLTEILDIVDKSEREFYTVPCNCKSIAENCGKPRNVCLLSDKGINSEWDRGHGSALTKEEAKELLKFANKSGLMQTFEEGGAVCNCCGDCCYPIRASSMIGARGLWPMKKYDIVWDGSACVNCGKCVALCNFGAFSKKDGKVAFDADKCWSCTICQSNCPVGAISLKQISQKEGN